MLISNKIHYFRNFIDVYKRQMQELGDMFDREVAETDSGRDFDLANPGGTEENVKSAPKTKIQKEGWGWFSFLADGLWRFCNLRDVYKRQG